MGDRTILHSDMNCFYASVEMLHHPELEGKPLAVGGDPEARHGIVLTANYIPSAAIWKIIFTTLAESGSISNLPSLPFL